MCRLPPTVLAMSILAQASPATRDGAPDRLLSLPLAMTFLAEFTSLTSFFLLLSVLPMLASAAGASSSGAGLITGSLLLGTVAAEAAAASGIRRFGYRTMLAAGAVLLGVPALALLPREPQAVMMGVSFVRGLGFGLCGVTTGALTATLLPPGRRGEGLGLLGLVSGVPAVVALPAGVWLAGHHLATVVAAMAAAAGLLPLTTIRLLPGRGQAGGAPPTARARRAPGARAAAAAHLRGQHDRGRRARLIPPAREGGVQQSSSAALLGVGARRDARAAGGAAGTATGTVTPGCSSRRCSWRRSAWPRWHGWRRRR